MPSSPPDVVRRFLERDPQRAQAFGGHVGAFAVNHLRAVVLGQARQHFHGQHVAARKRLVTQDAVVQQVIGRAVVDAQQRRLHRARAARAAGFREPDVRSQMFELDFGIDSALVIEHPGTELVEAEAAAAVPTDTFRNAALLAIDDFHETRLAMRARVLAHFDADPASAHLVRDGGGGAGAEEAVEDQVAFIGGDMNNTLEQCFWLRSAERRLRGEQGTHFVLRASVATHVFFAPKSPRYQIGYLIEVPLDTWPCVPFRSPPNPSLAAEFAQFFFGNPPVPPGWRRKNPARWSLD